MAAPEVLADRLPAATGPGPVRGNRLTPLVAALGVALLFVWLYVLAHHLDAGAINADAATVALEGRSLDSGNLLLAGWQLSNDSWWSLDAVVYAAAEAVGGFGPFLLLAVPTAVATGVVTVGVLLARGGRRGAAGLAGAALLVAVLAFPARGLVYLLLANPWHQSTMLVALLAFLALRRNRFGPGWVAAVVLLGVCSLGDLQLVAYGVVPLMVGGAVAALRRRSLRAGAVAFTAGLAGGLFYVVVKEATHLIGRFSIGPANPIASRHQMVANIRHVPGGLMQILGVHNSDFGFAGVPPALSRAHDLTTLVVVVAAAVALVRLVVGVVRGTPAPPTGTAPGGEAEPWRLDDILLIACFGPVAAYVGLTFATQVPFLRYLTATVVFAAILAGRLTTRAVARWRSGSLGAATSPDGPRHRTRSSRPPGRRALAAVAVAVAVVTAAVLVLDGALAVTRTAAAPETDSQLIAFLEAHHLRSGVGDYWDSAETTVQSGGRVRVRPVVTQAGVLVAYSKGEQKAWFDQVGFRFLVWTGPVGLGGVDAATAIATWGPPHRRYLVRGYFHVLVWARPHVITRLQPNGRA